VLLDVPVLKVEEITLTVEGLRAHVAVPVLAING
jgi:hypothetical protein